MENIVKLIVEKTKKVEAFDFWFVMTLFAFYVWKFLEEKTFWNVLFVFAISLVGYLFVKKIFKKLLSYPRKLSCMFQDLSEQESLAISIFLFRKNRPTIFEESECYNIKNAIDKGIIKIVSVETRNKEAVYKCRINKFYYCVLGIKHFKNLFDISLMQMNSIFNIAFLKDKKVFTIPKEHFDGYVTIFLNGEMRSLNAQRCTLEKNGNNIYELKIKGSRCFREEDNYLFNDGVSCINMIIANNSSEALDTFVYLKNVEVCTDNNREKFLLKYKGRLELLSFFLSKDCDVIVRENNLCGEKELGKRFKAPNVEKIFGEKVFE